jgi:hypothetical protein
MNPLPSPSEWRPGFAKRADNFDEIVTRAAAWRWAPGVTVWRVEDAVMLGASDLKPMERLVLLHYVRRLNQEQLEKDVACVWPSSARVAMEIEITASTLRGYRRALEAKGYMVRDYNRANRPADVEAYDLAPLMARLGELEATAEAKEQAFKAQRAALAEHVVAHRSIGAQAPGFRRLEQSQSNERVSVQGADAQVARSQFERARRVRAAGSTATPTPTKSSESHDRPRHGSSKRAGFEAGGHSAVFVSAEMVEEELAAAVELSPRVAALLPSPVLENPAAAHVFDVAGLAERAARLLPHSERNNADTFRWGLERHGVRVFTMLAVSLEDPGVSDPAKYFGRLASMERGNAPDLRFNLRRIAARRGQVAQSAFPSSEPTPEQASPTFDAPGQDSPEWQALARQLKRVVREGPFGSWFSRCGYHGVEDGVLRLSTANRIARDKIVDNYLAEVSFAAGVAGLGADLRIDVVCRRSD